MINSIPTFNRYSRRFKACAFALQYPLLLRKALQSSVEFLYAEGILKKGGIAKRPVDQLFDIKKEVKLQNYGTREGNVTYYELLVLSSIVANSAPQRLLEIGTFDGNTTLQMALNAPSNATLHTIDLPCNQTMTSVPILNEDVKYVTDKAKQGRKYIGTPVESKIVQHFGDSTTYDFRKFIMEGRIDLCFIDGGHSYECVKSDTENALKVLSPRGMILWHDFSPNCSGNYRYLCELGKSLPLIHLEGTSLVLYKSSSIGYTVTVQKE